MPALAGLLILIGYQTIKPGRPRRGLEDRAGPEVGAVRDVRATIIIPLQFAVLVGVGLSVILYVVQQSGSLTLTRWELEDDGTILETEPPARLGEREIVVLEPYGSLFFAAAAQFDSAFPAVDSAPGTAS